MLGAVPVGVGGVVADGGIATSFENDANGVVSVVEHLRDIVSVEIHAFGIPRKRRFQQFLRRNFRAVEIGAIHAHAAHIQPRIPDVIFKAKVLAKITSRQAGFTYKHIILKLMTNPFGLPIILVQQTDFKRFDLAFHFGFLAVCSYGSDDFPIGFVATLEGFACVWDVKHLR